MALLWLVLFVPITILGVEPAMSEIVMSVSATADRMVLPYEIGQMTNAIVWSAMPYHLVYGAIFGYATSILRQELLRK